MGVVKTSIWAMYDGSVIDSVYEVIEVENTVSPKTDLAAPNDRPVNFCPDLRCSVAGWPSVSTAGGGPALVRDATKPLAAVANARDGPAMGRKRLTATREDAMVR